MVSCPECDNVAASTMQGFERFCQQIREGEQIVKGPDLFWREDGDGLEALGESGGELHIMRRWNSHTPTIYDVLGGGYFLRWGGKGTVIDPGCCFLKLFRSKTRYTIGDMDMVITTHDHVDHCQDLAALITLFREFNRWSIKSKQRPPKIWDMIYSYGIAEMYGSIINHPDNAPFLFRQTVLPINPQEIESRQDIPSFLRVAHKKRLLAHESYLRSFHREAEQTITRKYHYNLSVLPAYHKELLGKMTSFGLKIKLNRHKDRSGKIRDHSWTPLPTIVISGDTSINDNTDLDDTKGELLSSFYNGATLLILHVGGLEDEGMKRYNPGGHLGFHGVVEVLARMEPKPKLVILTEWGYEFGRMEVHGRTGFVRHVVDRLKAMGQGGSYYAAVGTKEQPPKNIPEHGIPILPADIGLRIRLPDLAIESAEKRFTAYTRVYARERLEEIEYCTIP